MYHPTIVVEEQDILYVKLGTLQEDTRVICIHIQVNMRAYTVTHT